MAVLRHGLESQGSCLSCLRCCLRQGQAKRPSRRAGLEQSGGRAGRAHSSPRPCPPPPPSPPGASVEAPGRPGPVRAALLSAVDPCQAAPGPEEQSRQPAGRAAAGCRAAREGVGLGAGGGSGKPAGAAGLAGPGGLAQRLASADGWSDTAGGRSTTPRHVICGCVVMMSWLYRGGHQLVGVS